MAKLTRRAVLGAIAAGSVVGLAGCSSSCPDEGAPVPDRRVDVSADPAGPFDAVPGSTWRRPRNDPGNAGYAPDAEPPSGSVGIRWRTRLPDAGDDGVAHDYSTPAVADGTVYVATHDGVHAIDLRDGTAGWHAEEVTPGTMESSFDYDRERVPPVVGRDGTVYVGGVDAVSALDPADGSVRWTFEGSGDAADGDARGDADDGDGDRTDDGIPDEERTQNGEAGAPAVVDDTVLAPREGTLHALDAGDGTERWSAPLPEFYDGEFPAVADGVVVVATNAETVAYDLATGDRRWQIRARADDYPVVADGTVYLGNSDGLQGYGLDGGEELWTFERGGGRGYTAPVVAEDAIYAVERVGEGPDASFALDRTDGRPSPRWCSYLGEGTVTAAGGDLAFALQGGGASAGSVDLVAFTGEVGEAPWGLSAGVGYDGVVPPAVLDGAVVAVDGGGVTALGEV